MNLKLSIGIPGTIVVVGLLIAISLREKVNVIEPTGDSATNQITGGEGDAPIPERTGTATGDFNFGGTEMTYAHVQPGEYSEVYLSVRVVPGEDIAATLKGPAVEKTGIVKVVTDEDGLAYFVWKIFESGTYTARITSKRGDATLSIMVK